MSIITTTDKQIFTADTEMIGVSSNLSNAYVRVTCSEDGGYLMEVMVGDTVMERFYTLGDYSPYPSSITVEVAATVSSTRVYHREIEFHSLEEYVEYKEDPEYYIAMNDIICDTEDYIDDTTDDLNIDSVEEL